MCLQCDALWKFRMSHPARADSDISTAHPVPSFKSEALPKTVVKFVRRDVSNRFYANRRKLVKKKACILPDLDLDLESNVYISESLTSSRINLFCGINKERKPLKWKHIWTQNGRIFIKEADTRRSYSFDSFEDLAKFRSSLRQ